MKVQDNLENYEIPYKYRLTIEEEEELAKDVAEIIPELEKRRTSKVQTRKYFKQHLRYTSNVRAKNMAEGKDEAKYEEDEDYTPLEGEYTWASDLLQPVLLDVLSVERFKYGYIVNLLENDILSRGTLRYKNAWTVSDNLVQFSNEFDIDAIREEVAKIEDIRKRIVYLQTKKADLQVTDLLTISEKRDWGPEYDDKIDALIALEEKRLELYPSGYERTAPAPVPLSSACNPYIPASGIDRFAGSCELTRLAMAVWRACPEEAPAYWDWLLEDGPAPEEAESRARALAGSRIGLRPGNPPASLSFIPKQP